MGKQRKNETRQEYNARMNAYMKLRYKQRRDAAIVYLGSKCVDCGRTTELEFDHVNPKEKSFNMGEIFAGKRKDVLWAEVDKCVLRCMSCHAHVTTFQRLQSVDVLGSIL
jgi:5-methylcytosine-specific restriction endonuclease McrA